MTTERGVDRAYAEAERTMNSRERRTFERLSRRRHRDAHALQLYVQGLPRREIQRQLIDTYGPEGLQSESTIWAMVRRALEDSVFTRATIEQARELASSRYEALISAWMPSALGLAVDEDGNPLPPSLKAAEAVARFIEKQAQLTGAATAPQAEGPVNINILNVPADADDIRRQVQQALAGEADKRRLIEGELAGAGTTLDDRQAGVEETGQLPPPIPPKEKS